MASTLERSIFDTLRYFDIFAMPVTAVQVWRSLVIDRTGSGVRWGGGRAWSLAAVQRALRESPWLAERTVACWGYFALRGSVPLGPDGAQAMVEDRLARHVIAQRKWRLARRAAWFLARLPLVRMIAVTGSLALWNTRPQSDFDLFVVARRGRIWVARLLLLLTTQLLGRRRKYWEGQAPDKVCLNHYITDDALVMPVEIRSIYTAMLYAHAVPLAGGRVYWRWREANGPWLRRWLMFPEAPRVLPRQYVRVGWVSRMLRGWLEGILLEPIGASCNRFAERIQRRAIAEHGRAVRRGRIKLSAVELAFHPDSKEAAVLQRFVQDPGQRALL
jgi:hypothetical protein